MLVRKYTIIFIAFLVSVASAVNVQARNGIYFTLESGLAKQSGLPSAQEVGAHQVSSTRFPSAYRMGVGYNHDLYDALGIGLDIGYGDYGKTTYAYTTNETSLHSRNLEFLAGMMWHKKHWDIIGKAGGIRQTLIITGWDAQDTQTRICPKVSIGTAYNITPHVAMMVNYAHVYGRGISNFNNVRNKTPSLNEILAGIRYTF